MLWRRLRLRVHNCRLAEIGIANIRAIVLHAGIDGHTFAKHRRVSVLRGMFAATALTAAPSATPSASAARATFALRLTIGLRLALSEIVPGFTAGAFFARQHRGFD